MTTPATSDSDKRELTPLRAMLYGGPSLATTGTACDRHWQLAHLDIDTGQQEPRYLRRHRAAKRVRLGGAGRAGGGPEPSHIRFPSPFPIFGLGGPYLQTDSAHLRPQNSEFHSRNMPKMKRFLGKTPADTPEYAKKAIYPPSQLTTEADRRKNDSESPHSEGKNPQNDLLSRQNTSGMTHDLTPRLDMRIFVAGNIPGDEDATEEGWAEGRVEETD